MPNTVRESRGILFLKLDGNPAVPGTWIWGPFCSQDENGMGEGRELGEG